MDERRIDRGPVHLLGEIFQLLDCLQQEVGIGRGQRGDLAAVGLLEGLSAAQGGLQIAIDGGVIERPIEVVELPGDSGGAVRRGFGGHRCLSWWDKTAILSAWIAKSDRSGVVSYVGS